MAETPAEQDARAKRQVANLCRRARACRWWDDAQVRDLVVALEVWSQEVLAGTGDDKRLPDGTQSVREGPQRVD